MGLIAEFCGFIVVNENHACHSSKPGILQLDWKLQCLETMEIVCIRFVYSAEIEGNVIHQNLHGIELVRKYFCVLQTIQILVSVYIPIRAASYNEHEYIIDVLNTVHISMNINNHGKKRWIKCTDIDLGSLRIEFQ